MGLVTHPHRWLGMTGEFFLRYCDNPIKTLAIANELLHIWRLGTNAYLPNSQVKKVSLPVHQAPVNEGITASTKGYPDYKSDSIVLSSEEVRRQLQARLPYMLSSASEVAHGGLEGFIRGGASRQLEVLLSSKGNGICNMNELHDVSEEFSNQRV